MATAIRGFFFNGLQIGLIKQIFADLFLKIIRGNLSNQLNLWSIHYNK
jgi:hypothetical protein